MGRTLVSFIERAAHRVANVDDVHLPELRALTGRA